MFMESLLFKNFQLKKLVFHIFLKLKLVYQVNSCKITSTLNLFIKFNYVQFIFDRSKKTIMINISLLYSYYFLTKVLSKSLVM